MKKKYMLILLLTFFIPSLSSQASSISEKLSRVVSQISSTKRNLNQETVARNNIQNKLRSYDIDIGNLSKKIVKTQSELNDLKFYLQTLNTRQKDLEKMIESNKYILLQQIRSAYMLGDKNMIKMLLNQENPNDFDRMLVYHKAISKHRYELIKSVNNTINEIKQNKDIIGKKRETLISLQNDLMAQEKEMQQNRYQRRALLVNLNQLIRTNHQKLLALDDSKTQLESTLNNLKPAKDNGSKFNLDQQHKLPWPTEGEISVSFGTRIQGSHLKWNGILINAKEGDSVRAVAPGKVVFANWMPGFGLLLILDHGNGFMSIYGRNNSLFKSTGDSVNAGDLIATVGMSGGHSKPALYFSLRLKGKPIDPTEWCTTIGQTA